MNKQEVIKRVEQMGEYERFVDEPVSKKSVLNIISQIHEPKKVAVPKYVADWYEKNKDDFEDKVYELCLQYKHRGDELPQGVAWWFGDSRNKPIETLVMMHKFGYEVEKEKLYTAKNKQTGEYLCYCFEFFHDKNSSSENQRFTAEEKRWKELGYWGNDLYVFEEAEGEDE